MKMKSVIAAIAASVGLMATAAVVPGEWNTKFEESLAYAEENNVPIVVVWGNTSCSHCKELHAVLESDTIMDWAEEHPIMMVSKHEKYGSKNADYRAAREWIRGIDSNVNEFPLVGVYWKDANGTVRCSKAFSGRDGEMPATTPKGDLAGQFANSLDMLVGEYPPAPTGDASFVTADTENDRLEAEEDTEVVYVPVQRKSGEKVEVNYLKVAFPDSSREEKFTWGAGVTNLMLSVTMTSFKAGEKVKLTLADKDGIAMAKSSIAMVEDKDNSTTNPYWLGESFGVAEWTMDLDAAKAKTAAASGDAYTFVMFTGALWCPWCQGLDAGVLSTSQFKSWAKKSKINLVELDNPRRPADPAGPTGAPPTLLRYAAGMNNVIGKSVSGASYLSRKSIKTVEAEKVLVRNHTLGYNGPDKGGYCAPEAARSGYPTIVLLRKDGTVAGRFAEYAPTTTGYDTNENMQRFKDFLYLADEGDYLASWLSTTSRTLGLDAIETAPFQINDATEWFRIEGPFDNYITVDCLADQDVTLTIVAWDGKTWKDGKPDYRTIGQPAKNRVTVERPTTTDALYLRAECYEKADSTMYASGSTRFMATFALSTSEEEPEQTVAFKSLTKAEQKYLNPSLYAKQSATVPVYEAINLGGKRLVGTLAVSVTSANKISAKFTGEKTVSFSGTWDEISLGSGAVTTTLAKKVSKVDYTLNLTMDAKGGFEALLMADGERIGSGTAAAGDLSSYSGNYTVTLVDKAGEAGTGYLTVKITTAGKATVKGVMSDGTSISISAVISPNGDGTATLPVYKYSKTAELSTALMVDANADETWGTEGKKYTVNAVPACLETWTTDAITELNIYGGYWASTSPLAICENYGLSDVLDVVIAGETNDFVTATKSGFKVTKEVLTSLSFTKSTGVFSGKAKVLSSADKVVTATVKGVLLPGLCGECGEEVIEVRPFGSGTLYYKSGRKTVSMPIDLVSESAE